MPSVYLSKETKQKLYQFINRSRVSPIAFSEKRLNNPNQAVQFLLRFALRFDFNYLWDMTNQVLVQGEMDPELFDNEESRRKIILKQFEGKENEAREND